MTRKQRVPRRVPDPAARGAATQAARRAGHGVAVLLKIYAHCTDGQADAAKQRITDALAATEGDHTFGDENDADSQTAA